MGYSVAQSKTSKGWLKEHFDDPFVKQAQKEGYRSRASYKLLEVQEKDRLFRPGMTVVDLGSAPGGWSQVASRLIGDKGRIIASDILPMDSIADVTFIEGDFTEDSVFEAILAAIGDQPVDLVISDMAPRMSGVVSRDQALALELAEAALKVAGCLLTHHGTLLVKVFEGETTTAFRHQVQERFERHVSRKPAASRNESRERYVIATNPLAGPPSGLEKQ